MSKVSHWMLRIVFVSTFALVIVAWVLAGRFADFEVRNKYFAFEVLAITLSIVVGVIGCYAFDAGIRVADRKKIPDKRALNVTTGYLLLCGGLDALFATVLGVVIAGASVYRNF